MSSAGQVPVSVAHVAACGAFGGIESVLAALAEGHAARGHHVRVVLVLDPDPRPQPLEQRLLDAGIETHALRLPARAYRRERHELRTLLSGLGPGVVHTHGTRADVLGSGIGRRLGMATLSTAHGFAGGDRKNRLYEWLQERAVRRVDAVVAVSQPIVDRLVASGVAPDRVHLVPNAWCEGAPLLDRAAARRRLGLDPGETVFGWVGRLSREKGADVLLDAVAHLADTPGRVCIIGDGPVRRELEAQAQGIGVAHRVVWCGEQKDAGRLFSAFDVLVSSSRTEGTPIVLFEAMHAGVPIVATAVGGVPAMLDPSQAWLVPSEAPRVLADAMREALARPEATRRCTRARERLARDFAAGPWLDAYEALYRRIA